MNVTHLLSGMRIVDGQPYIRGDAYVADLRELAAACRELAVGRLEAAYPDRRIDVYLARMLERCADQADAELIGRVSATARTRPEPSPSRTIAQPPSWIRPALWLLAASITGVVLAELDLHGPDAPLVFHLLWLSAVVGLALRLDRRRRPRGPIR